MRNRGRGAPTLPRKPIDKGLNSQIGGRSCVDGCFECVGSVKMDTDTLKRICQNGSVADFTARKAVMYAEIGTAANFAYHFGLCQALMKEALVT